MAVHSICPFCYRVIEIVTRDNFCLIAVRPFGNCFCFSCAHLPSDPVGNFLGLQLEEPVPANTGVLGRKQAYFQVLSA